MLVQSTNFSMYEGETNGNDQPSYDLEGRKRSPYRDDILSISDV
jgi:hypothetical protein